MLSGFLYGAVHAAERPWGVITPFGGVTTEQRGFQGRYNPWERGMTERQAEPPAQVRKRIRQGWHNIYRPWPTDEEALWPDGGKDSGKGLDRAPKRTFWDKSQNDEEQWPERGDSHKPYRPVERFQTPFGTFAPNMPPAPFAPYGGYYPSWQRY